MLAMDTMDMADGTRVGGEGESPAAAARGLPRAEGSMPSSGFEAAVAQEAGSLAVLFLKAVDVLICPQSSNFR